MPRSLARVCFVLDRNYLGGNMFHASSDCKQFSRDLVSGLRQRGLESVPNFCHPVVQDSLCFTVCDIVLTVGVSIDNYYFLEYAYRPNTESATPRQRPSASTA